MIGSTRRRMSSKMLFNAASAWAGATLALSVIALGGAGAVVAQEPATQSCGSPGGSVVIARIVDDSTGLAVGGSRVHLISPICNGVADENGRVGLAADRPGP